MLDTVDISTPPTNAAEVVCNENFFQIGYFYSSICSGNYLTFPLRFNFNRCNDEYQEEGIYITLNKCTDPIPTEELNKYPYKNGTYEDFQRIFGRKTKPVSV